MRLEKTSEFVNWLENLQIKTRALVESRLFRIEEYEHFGIVRNLGNSLAELKWANGLRVYFSTRIDQEGNIVILLLGGIKNAQEKDIQQARKILEKYAANRA